MLCVASAASGDVILQLDVAETSALVEANSRALHLKQRLATIVGYPRFRQRLFYEGGGEMHDDDLLTAMNLQLVILDFWPAKSKDVENLIWACEENYPEDLNVLLQKPLDPNIPDRDGRAALHSAAFAGHGSCLSLLLEASADKDAWEKGSGQTPLHVAALNGKLQVLSSCDGQFLHFINRLRRVPPATMEKGYPANQQPLHWPSKNMAFVKTLALAFNTLFVSKVFLWKRGS